MKRAIHIFFGLLYGILPIIVAIFLGIVFYQSFPNIIGISIISVLCIGAFLIGKFIYKRVVINGPIDFMSHIHASPELDNLEPLIYEETRRRYPDELVSLIKNDTNLMKGGTLCFYGDWFGERYKNNHKILDASFDKSENLLIIIFDNNQSLEVQNPQHIFEASTFLKILKADNLKFILDISSENNATSNSSFLFYKKGEKKIATFSNISSFQPLFDVSMGEPALMIYSK